MIEVKLDRGQLSELAGMIADELRGYATEPTANRPLSVSDAAKALNVSESTITRRVKAGEIPTIPGLGRTLIPATAIADLLDCKRPNLNRKHDQ